MVEERLRNATDPDPMAIELKKKILSLSPGISDVEIVSNYNPERDYSWLRISIMKDGAAWNELIQKSKFNIKDLNSSDGRLQIYAAGFERVKEAVILGKIAKPDSNREMNGKIKFVDISKKEIMNANS